MSDMSLQEELDAFDLMRHAERIRSGTQIYATITITETFTIGLDAEDHAAIVASEEPGADRRTSVQNYVENMHRWGAFGESDRNVTFSMRPAS